MDHARPKRRRSKAARVRVQQQSGTATRSELTTPAGVDRPEGAFVDDPQRPRATPDSLDDASATAVESGIEGVRNNDAKRGRSP
jgi:hypothetical protein